MQSNLFDYIKHTKPISVDILELIKYNISHKIYAFGDHFKNSKRKYKHIFFLNKVKQYAGKKFKTLNVQSIYYKLKEDFKSYLTFRCINNRSTLNRPGLDHMCSNEFCFEKWAASK